MADKMEVKQKLESGKTKNLLDRRTFVSSLVAIFCGLNVFVFGKRNGWWRRKIHVFVEGPLPLGKKVPLSSLQKGGDFLVAKDLELKIIEGFGALLYVGFEFDKSVRESETIDLLVCARDDSGNEIFRNEVTLRNTKPKEPVLNGATYETFFNLDNTRFEIPPEIASRIQNIDLTFLK